MMAEDFGGWLRSAGRLFFWIVRIGGGAIDRQNLYSSASF